PLMFEEWEEMRPQTVFVSATPAQFEMDKSHGRLVEQIIRPTGLIEPICEIRPVAQQVDDLLEEIRRVKGEGDRILVTTLTKRMAEDLTDYLTDMGVAVRYMHSDVETLERIEIVRGLRLGEFDVLVGINLLREGLDIPEVGLVAILDADKEGFLRSETSMIQTIGRAARNADGKVILYADRMTGSMQRALDETDRRRKIQIAYNEKHNITPRSVRREVTDVVRALTGGQGIGDDSASRKGRKPNKVGAPMKQRDVEKEIQRLEKKMQDAAQAMQFESAAIFRDRILALQKKSLMPELA
ncbi:MAG: UvrB/UvrC motif-containing protein, partial [Magnetococcales bacterium]|nr:UvrB/UvrC motif-containing protein [Magnetococcales bacterium]